MAENHQNQTEPPNERKRCKRSADQSLVLSDDDIDSNTFPHFLIVQSVDNEPIKLSIFSIQKLIQMAVGSIKTAKKLSNGSVLLEVSNKV
jgi:mannose/fructose/N-acetylgalactosamine-specific phosphotransferase system component IIB